MTDAARQLLVAITAAKSLYQTERGGHAPDRLRLDRTRWETLLYGIPLGSDPVRIEGLTVVVVDDADCLVLD